MKKLSEKREKIIALSIVVFAFLGVPIFLYLFVYLVLLEIFYFSRYLLYTNNVDLFYSIGILASLVVVGYILFRLVKWVRN